MKFLLLLCDGMSDYPSQHFGGKTPMEIAEKPCMDSLAAKSEVGLAKTVPNGFPPGSDVANLSVLGYDPAVYYSGRSPLEAANMGIGFTKDDVATRCNLVTLSDESDYRKKVLVDYCAGDIETAEAKILIEFLQEKLGNSAFAFYPGISYRHCLIRKNSGDPGLTTPPHDIIGRTITEYLPENAEFLQLMEKSYSILSQHPINIERKKHGKNPANSIWLWGSGRKSELPAFTEKYGITGTMISAVDLLKGIAKLNGMNVIDVDGATGYIDTNFVGKRNAAIQAFENGSDFVYLHLEAPDECGHRGEYENKVRAIEIIDRDVLAPLKEFMENYDDYKIIIMPDHPTPLDLKTHTSDPVPYMIYHKNSQLNSKIDSFTEASAKSAGMLRETAYTMLQNITMQQ